jgi:hypothetical protein
MTHTPYHLEVSLSQQKLYLKSGNENIEVFEISTSAKGAG